MKKACYCKPIKVAYWSKFLVLLGLLGGGAKAQYVDYGQNPIALHWQQINTPHFQIIFPQKFTMEGKRMSVVLENVYLHENKSLTVNTNPISVILQNQGVESNGFVLLAPRRSEFFAMPPQDMEPTDWLNSLAVHEMRHVVQMDRIFSGHRWQLLESIQLGLFGVIYPAWFFEGDAVDMETVLSHSGRGRLPSWDKELRANLLSGKEYSYSKYTLGSYKDNVPDYYRIGYFMVTKMRRDYGKDAFNAIYSGALKLRPFPLSASLKRYSGYSTNQYFKQTTNELKSIWEKQMDERKPEAYPSINHRHESISTDYLLPRVYNDSILIFLKQGLNQTPRLRFVNIHTGVEHTIVSIGPQTVPNFDYAAGVLTWDEERFDPRYAYHTYSVIMAYDLTRHKKTQLTQRTRLFSPSLSADAKKIVAVNVTYENKFSLVILERNGGKVISTYSNADNYFFLTPRFDVQGGKIIAVAAGNQGKALVAVDPIRNKLDLIKPFSFIEITRPYPLGQGKFLYSSAANGLDNIYLLDTTTKADHSITNARYGAYNPVVYGDHLYFNNYVATNYDLSEISVAKAESKHFDDHDNFIAYYKPLLEQEPGSPVLGTSVATLENPIGKSTSPLSPNDTAHGMKGGTVKKYSELGHLLYFHSILPDIQNINTDANNFIAGLKLSSTNKLNTLQIDAGAYYDNGYKSAEYQANVTYKKFYPWVFTSVLDRKTERSVGVTNGKRLIGYSAIFSRRTSYNGGVYVPLNFTVGNQVYAIGGQVVTSVSRYYQYMFDPRLKFSGFKPINFPLHYNAYFDRNALQAVRDIYPHWGQNIAFDFEHLPFGGADSKGQLWYVNSRFYFPGLFSHHSLAISYNFEHATGIYEGNRDISEISGFASLPPNNLKNTLLMDYYFPIAYPDWQISSLAYIKRIRGSFFYNQENLGSNFTTFGAAATIDGNLLRYYLPNFSIGTKTTFFTDKQISSPTFELILGYTY